MTPGVDPQTLNISVLQNRLTLSGEKPGVAEIKAEAFQRNERASGKFVRSIDLPLGVKPNSRRAAENLAGLEARGMWE